MSEPSIAAAKATWEAPGPGSWTADRSHSLHPTRLFRRIATEHTATAYREAMRDFGSAMETIDMAFVNGQLYRRLVPLVGARFDRGKPPPNAVLKVVTRLHPAFRRAERQATNTLATKPYLDAINGWYDRERDEWASANRALQAVAPDRLDDAELAEHINDLDAALVRGWLRHHRLHAYDLGPIGDLLAHGDEWGLDPVEVMYLLRGASPATIESTERARDIAAALRAGGIDPETIDDIDSIRAVPDAAVALDRYLETFGWRLIVGYDIDGATLHEIPTAICAIVRSSEAREAVDDIEGRRAVLRGQCPDPGLFDELVDDARAAYGLRDDNGPLTWAWPAGLMRRAYLEAGSRLVASSRLQTQDHVFEIDAPELAEMMSRSSSGPSADEAAWRAEHRAWEATLASPDYLGAPPVEPDLSAIPPSLKRIMAIVVKAVSYLEPDPERVAVPLQGLGIGDSAYRGTACVVNNAVDAIDRLGPGDVLVTPFTAPSFNAVLPIAGALVVQEGGLLCHAAVMARELDLPAVVGCHDALTRIDDGDTVEVDPSTGRVTVI